MVLGIGIDLVDVKRIDKLIQVWGAKFTSKLFTQNEIDYCAGKHNGAECFAARFAAKEALAKALGHGWCKHFRWTDVEICRAPSGQPSFKVGGITQGLVANKHVLLSLSHTRRQAAAVVTVEDE
ncbi:MAG: holo-ACP synthase [bacterium]